MNAEAHRRIMLAAYHGLPQELQQRLAPTLSLLPDAGNYPDWFDNPNRSVGDKDRLDPDWRRYCHFPEHLAGHCMHQWPAPPTDSPNIRPMLEYLLSQAVDAIHDNDIDSGIKFLGCLSHYLGDATQPAHLVDLNLLARLIPPPADMADFHYHQDLEAVTGCIPALRPPRLLGALVEEAMWRLAGDIADAFYHCQRYVVPTLQALFADDRDRAEELAAPPMTLAAEMTLDVVLTAFRLADQRFVSEEVQPLQRIDLRHRRPIDMFIDSVYGQVLHDTSRDPDTGNLHPATLQLDNGQVWAGAALGVLPHSGLTRPRDCFVTYDLPDGVFETLECLVGLHASLGRKGRVEFVVELDGTAAATSGNLDGKSFARHLKVDLGQATTVTLRVCDRSDGVSFWHNHALWGEPVLLRRNVTTTNSVSASARKID